jgi:hypothetical protein
VDRSTRARLRGGWQAPRLPEILHQPVAVNPVPQRLHVVGEMFYDALTKTRCVWNGRKWLRFPAGYPICVGGNYDGHVVDQNSVVGGEITFTTQRTLPQVGEVSVSHTYRRWVVHGVMFFCLNHLTASQAYDTLADAGYV